MSGDTPTPQNPNPMPQSSESEQPPLTVTNLLKQRQETKELFDRMRNSPETAKEAKELEEMRLAVLADFPELATTKQ